MIALMLINGALCWAAAVRLHAHRAPAENPLARKIHAVELDHLTLPQSLEYLSGVGHVQFQVDWTTLKAAGMDANSTVDVRLRNVSLGTALRWVLVSTTHNLAFDVHDDVIDISTPAALPRTVRIYDVSDLLSQSMCRFIADRPDTFGIGIGLSSVPVAAEPTDAMKALSKLIRESITIDEDYANGSNSPTIWTSGSHLIVVHSSEGHRKIAELLRLLRECDAQQQWRGPVPKSDIFPQEGG